MTTRRSLLATILATLTALVMAPYRWITTRFNPTPVTAPPRRRAGLGTFRTDAVAIGALQKLGITRTRITLYWNVWSGGGSYPTDFAASLAALDAAGIEPVIVVHSPPGVVNTLALGIAQLPGFMAARAAQFPGRIWQVLNEMDGNDTFSNGWFGVSAGNTQTQIGTWYGQVLGPTYDAIKAADPTATVIAGGIALEPTAFYAAMAAAAPGKYQAVSVHCYGTPVVLATQTKSIAMRAVLGSVPLWTTEWGDHSTDEAAQATAIGAVLDDNDRNNRFDRQYQFQLDDESEGYHVMRPDGTLRQAALLLPNRTAP